jgi:hypothetical protein
LKPGDLADIAISKVLQFFKEQGWWMHKLRVCTKDWKRSRYCNFSRSRADECTSWGSAQKTGNVQGTAIFQGAGLMNAQAEGLQKRLETFKVQGSLQYPT